MSLMETRGLGWVFAIQYVNMTLIKAGGDASEIDDQAYPRAV